MRIELDELQAIAAPEPTKTWNPIPHYEVYYEVEKCLEKLGITTVSTIIDTNKTGTNAFVTHKLDLGDAELNGERYPELGWRNSIDKKLSLGFTTGATVIVCSNLVFSGSWVDFRKHNNKLQYTTIREMANVGISEMIKHTYKWNAWHENLKEIPSNKEHTDHLFMRMLREGAVSSKQILDLVNAYDEEKDRYGESLYTAFNCATQTFRELALPTISDRSEILNRIIEEDRKNYVDVEYAEVGESETDENTETDGADIA